MKQLLTKSFLLLFTIVYADFAVEPSSVKTTTFGVGIDHNVPLQMSSVSYTNGLGQPIETKDSVSDTSERVVCTFYDEAGRRKNTTKPFFDEVYYNSFLPGNLNDPQIGDSLSSKYNSETQAYSETEYWDDPLGRVKKSLGPGATHVDEYSRSWTIGVATGSAMTNYKVYCNNGGGSSDSVSVNFNNDGFIVEIIRGAAADPLEVIFDALYTQFSDANPFTIPTHFLSIVRDPEENISQELKDLFGRTLATYVDTVLTNTNTAEVIKSFYQYDVAGGVLREIAPDDRGTKLIDDTEYKYNSLGQQIWRKIPDGGEFRYSYTPDGQIDTVKSIVNNSGTIEVVRMLSYDYDELGRLVHIQNWNTTAGTYDVVLKNFYDTKDDIVHINFFQVIPKAVRDRLRNLKGRLAGRYNMASGNAVYEIGELFSYDDEGRLENKIMVINNSSDWQSTAYQYDLHGKVTSEIFHYAGDVIAKEYSYDRFGRLDTVYHHEYDPALDSLINKQPIATYTYDDMRGVMESKKFDRIATDHMVEYAYDILDRITSMNMNSASGNGFSENNLTYTPAGNIDTANYRYHVGGVTGDSTFIYTYDNLYRLIEAKRNNSAYGSYRYDNLGRFNSKVEDATAVNTYQYYYGADGNTNRLKSTSRNPAGTVGYIYDKHGNMVVDLSKNLLIRYDWRDMPIEYLFYDNLGGVAFSTNTVGTWNGSTDLYEYVEGQSVNLESTVTMLYDADGNRVCKLEEKM